MKSLLKLGIMAAAVLALAACASEPAPAPKSPTKYPALNAELAPRYEKLAKDEAEEKDDADAKYFNGKAADAKGGFEVLPDAIASRTIAADKAGDLTAARAALMAKYGEGYAESMPAALAEAQTQFDCWIQEQEEGWQLLHIQRCRDGFNAAMAMMVPPPAPAPVAAAPKPAMKDMQQVIYFNFDESVLTNLSKTRLQNVVGNVAARKAPAVDVTAHTDTSGSEQYNLALSQRRAKETVDYLVEFGVPASVITARGVGESSPAVATGDGVKEVKNRRSVVVVSGQ